MLKRLLALLSVTALVAALQGATAPPAGATDLTLPNGGIVSIELITSDAQFSNTLSIANAS